MKIAKLYEISKLISVSILIGNPPLVALEQVGFAAAVLLEFHQKIAEITQIHVNFNVA